MKKGIVLVVGYSGGVGLEVSRKLVSEGYEVFGTFNKQSNNIISQNSFTKLQVDLRDVASIKELYEKLIEKDLYAIVNCAGIVKFEGEDITTDFQVWDETIAVNLSSNYYLAKLFYKNLDENGRFVMISSTDAFYGGTITASYSASKAGINSLTKSLCLAFKGKMIRVNTIAPEWISTPMIDGESKDFYKNLAEINPLGRIAEPRDIADLVIFLLSEKSNYLNGQVITLDGGYTNQDPTLLIEEEIKT